MLYRSYYMRIRLIIVRQMLYLLYNIRENAVSIIIYHVMKITLNVFDSFINMAETSPVCKRVDLTHDIFEIELSLKSNYNY